MIIVNILIFSLAVISLLVTTGDNKTFDINRSKFLKAVLPYGVILGHISAFNTQVFNVAIIGSFIVGVFFFISAYGLETKRLHGLILFNGLSARLSKLLLPLLIPALIYAAILYYQDKNVWQIILENLKAYQLVLPFTWFVIVLSVFYAIFYIASAFFDSTSNGRFLGFLTISICVFSAINFILFRETAAYTNFSSLCFPAGVFYKQHERQIVLFLQQKSHYLICLVLLLATGFLARINYLLPLTILIWSVLIIMLVTLINVKGGSILDFFSSISYEVYVCQGITFLFVSPRFGELPGMLHVIYIFVLTILIATVCHYLTDFVRGYLRRIRVRC